MASPFGVSWFCALFYSCICFLPQNGYNTALAFDQYESPGTSHQHHLLPLNTNYANKHQARRPQNFVPLQREPMHYRNQDEEGTFSNAGEDVVQRQPDPRLEFSDGPPPPVQKHEYSNGHQHPFGQLLKQHTRSLWKGVSFPTMNHFKRFIESLKVSFLTPGSDASGHFQTARETMKNVAEEASMGYRSNFAQEGTSHDDDNPAEVGNYNMPKEQLSLPNPAGSTSLRGYDKPASNLDSALYPHHSAATGYVSSNLADGGPREEDDLFQRASKNPFGQSTGNGQLGETHFPSGSTYRKDSSQRGHVAASSNNPSHSQSQDFNHYSSNIPKRNPLNAKYTPTDFTSDDKMLPVGFNLRENIHRGTQSDDVPQQRPPSLNNLVKSLYAPSNRLYIPKKLHKQRRPRPMAGRSYQPTIDAELKDTSSTPTIYQPVNDERGPQQQPNRSNLLRMRPPSSFRSSSRPNRYSRYQKSNPIHTVLTAQDRIEEISDPFIQNLASVMQTQNDNTRPKGMTSYGARKPKHQFSVPQRRSVVQNDGYKRAKRFGLQQNFIEPPNVKTIPVSLKRQTRNLVNWPSELQSALKGCVYWTNEDKRNGRGPKTSISSINALVKSRNHLGRATTRQGKVCYTPFQQVQKQSAIDQWKLALRQQNFKNEAY